MKRYLGDDEFYQMFDDIDVVIDDYLDYINSLKTIRSKKMVIRLGFEETKTLEPFKLYVLTKAGFCIEKFRRKHAIF